MADPLYTGDFFIDGNFSLKQEPISLDSNGITASMPIPTRKIMDMSNLREYGFEFIDDSSPSTSHENGSGPSMQSPGLYPPLNTNSMWCARDPEIKSETFKMDDDDIFQVDKADLIQGPTLAELNANDENLLEDLNFDDLLLPEENSYFINVGSDSSQTKPFNVPPLVQITNSCQNNNFQASSFPSGGFYKDSFNIISDVPSSPVDPILMPSKLDITPSSKHSSTSSLLLQSVNSSTPPPQAISPLQQKHSTLHELLLRKEKTEKPKMGQSVPGRSGMDIGSGAVTRQGRGMPPTVSRLSSSAPTHLGLDQIWQRREPRQHLLSTGSLAEAGSTSSLSTGGVLSPESHDFSHDEGFDSEDDSDHYEDFSSDEDGSMMSDNEGPSSGIPKSSLSKKERFFWQYNVQAKGPKGQRLVLKTKQEDPHVLNEVTDPVFSPSCSVRGIKHSGKARKGDGNDLTPNPRKLANIGRELDKLSRVINDMTPVSEVPFNVRPKTRKEKNKLASRACRLKKKAQHEANKLKLSGLETEHKRLNQGIFQMKQLLVMRYKSETTESQEEMTKQIDKIVKSATKVKIAGHTTEFVNRILEKVKNGVPISGLEELQPI